MKFNYLMKTIFAVFFLSSSHLIFADVLLPLDKDVKEALYTSPRVIGATSKKNALNYKADSIQSGHYEFTLKGSYKNRDVSGQGGSQFNESEISIERPIRSWGKGEADQNLANVTKKYANILYADSLHEASRDLLRLWFKHLKALKYRNTAQLNKNIADEILHITEVRFKVGEVAELDVQLAKAEQGRLKAALDIAQSEEFSSVSNLNNRYPPIKPIQDLIFSEVPVLEGRQEIFLKEYINNNHELNMLKTESEQYVMSAKRSDLEKIPDPTIGLFSIRERNGNETINGLSLSMAIPAEHRKFNSDMANAEAEVANEKVVELEQILSAEFQSLWNEMASKRSASFNLFESAKNQNEAAEKAKKAYMLGEGSISDLIMARRLANENQLSADLAKLDAFESYYRIKLDLHQIWDFD